MREGWVVIFIKNEARFYLPGGRADENLISVPAWNPGRHKSCRAFWIGPHLCLWKWDATTRCTFLWFSRSRAAATHSIKFKGMHINQQPPRVSSVEVHKPRRAPMDPHQGISSPGQRSSQLLTPPEFTERKRDTASPSAQTLSIGRSVLIYDLAIMGTPIRHTQLNFTAFGWIANKTFKLGWVFLNGYFPLLSLSSFCF